MLLLLLGSLGFYFVSLYYVEPEATLEYFSRSFTGNLARFSCLVSFFEMPKNSSSARQLHPKQHYNYKATVVHMVKNVEYVDFVQLHYLTAVLFT